MTTHAIPEGVAVFIYRCNPELEFLLMLRHPDDGGFWQGPGGGVEHGETYEQTARREIAEECALEVGTLEPIDAKLDFALKPHEIGTLYPLDASRFTIHFFIAPLAGTLDQPVYEDGAHVDHRWVSPEAGVQLLHTEPHRAAMRKAASIAAQRLTAN